MALIMYIVIFFFLVIFQTTILSSFAVSTYMYDLLLILVVYLGFYANPLRGGGLVLLMGIMMDCLTGGAFGVYTTSYIWLYAVVSVLIQYLHVTSRFLLVILLTGAVFWENCIVLMTIMIGGGIFIPSLLSIKIILIQICLAAVTGPVIFFMIQKCNEAGELWLKSLIESKEQKSDFS